MPNDLQLETTAFTPGDAIPRKFTCEGQDISPPLEWAEAPTGTRSFALIVDDPDAPGQTFTHWLLFNVPGDRTRLPQDVDVSTHFDAQEPGPREGLNDFSNKGYDGPCPPHGDDAHRYFFRLYALDSTFDLEHGATKEQLTSAMEGHVLDETELVARFQR